MKTFAKFLSMILTASLLNCNLSIQVSSAESESTPFPPETRVSSDESAELHSEHAYEPFAELEAREEEQAYRDSTSIVKNKILFSVLDVRSETSAPVYLTDSSDLCSKYDLQNICFLFESSNTQYGSDCYEVFYEAETGTDDIWDLVDQMKQEETVISAEPDFVWEKADVGDPIEVSPEEYAKETHFGSLNMQEVWDSLTVSSSPGYGTVVAVIDTGVDYNHKDLAANIWTNPGEIPDNGIDDDGNGYVDDIHGIDLIEMDGDPMDDHGHGTHVAGIIAMTPGNSGGVGIAYGAKIMCIKAGQSDGTFSSSDIAKAITYAADNGADVINMSFGGTGKSIIVEAALRDAFTTTVLVASAGNDGLPTTDAPPSYKSEDIYPAGYSYVLGVMATDASQQLAGFSNWDYKTGANCEYELAVPGVAIYSTLPNERYAAWSGTSMSAPCVSAAAAILRGEHPQKNKYTSRYIMGQLVSSSTDIAKKYDKLTDKYYNYPMINILDSLTKQPKPELSFKDIYLFDSDTISANNNNDGIAQPNETIDLGLSVWNRWGAAKDIHVRLDAPLSPGGVENPYVEILNSDITLSDVGTFTEVNNGWVYENGALSGTSNPLRIRIKDGTPNDAHIQLNLTVTAHNDIDENDQIEYKGSMSYTVTVQNGYAISGVIHEDMTLTADKYWIIQNSVLIPEDVTVTVEPGTQIQFGSIEPSNTYNQQSGAFIQVEGRFIAEGTKEKPIEMFAKEHTRYIAIKSESSSSSSLLFDDNFDNSYTKLKYIKFIDISIEATEIDHCNIYSSNIGTTNNVIWTKTISNTLMINHHYGDIISSEFSNNLFFDCKRIGIAFWPFQIMDECLIDINGNPVSEMVGCFKNNVVFGINNDPAIYIEEIDSRHALIHPNAYLRQKIYNNSATPIVGTDSGHALIDLSGNYWGTTNPNSVKNLCYDADWNVSLNDLIQEPFLTLEDDMSEIYPFMTEAYLTDSDGNRITQACSGQTVQMHACFNRDMAQDIQPTVTFGGSEPYSDYSVQGDWVSAREWVGTIQIDPFIDMGRMYIRSEGAVAADDRWLVTGEDTERFFFEITKNSAQAMSLQGIGSSGTNELNWMQDDYDTLAGYNLYRSTSYNPETDITAQHFTKINGSILAADELSFSDRDVQQGVDYYYYFTVVDTAFKESKPSNVIMCTPLDEVAPVITHTPVTIAASGESVAVQAQITDNVRVQSTILHYRVSGGTWATATMRNIRTNIYRANISAYEISGEALEYYITASDGNNAEFCGTEEQPYLIQIDSQHNFGEGVITVQPTCTDPGEMTYTCADCGKVITDVIPALDHDFSSEWTVDQAATCTAQGSKSHHCSRCNEVSDVTEIEILPHEYDSETVITPNSCTYDGVRRFECKNCEHYYEETIPATGHQYLDTVIAPTCNAHGYTLHICEHCGDQYCSDFTDEAEHEMTETILNPATCTTDGVMQYVCGECDLAETVRIPATGHLYEDTVIVPSCTEQGYTVHVCQNCNHSYIDNYTAPTGHEFGEWIVKEEAGCTTSGTAERECIHCGVQEQKELPSHGHHFSETVIPPTVEIGGYTEYECDDCGLKYTDHYTEKLTEEVLKGDVDSDGELTLKDVVIMRRFIVGGWYVEIDLNNGDMNDDGEISLIDVVMLRRIIVNLGSNSE